jgi:orotate phosphoribosyltransferase
MKDDKNLGSHMVLIDNVITTGATIFSAQKALSNYGKPIAVAWAIDKDTKSFAAKEMLNKYGVEYSL